MTRGRRVASHRALVVAGALAATAGAVGGQPRPGSDSSSTWRWGAFVDAYYAWDFGCPPTRDRSFAGGTPFTTQPARHNEFNVNLAFLEVVHAAPDTRGRLAVQAGTSVQANYRGEPAIGTTSGPMLAQLLQEASVGVRLRDALWLDLGIQPSHVGMEGWVSRDNLTYTRSLAADYSPYYAAGVRATWQPAPRWSAQLHVVNGWQVISENNDAKGVGLRVDAEPTTGTTVSYYNFFTQEPAAEANRQDRLRTLHGLGVRSARGRLTWLLQADLGSEARGDRPTARWHGVVGIVHWRVAADAAVVVRGERFHDPSQGIVATGSWSAVGADGPIRRNGPLQATGWSVGLDAKRGGGLLWRTELRALHNTTPVFPDGRRAAPRTGTVLVVSSLALTR